MQFTERMLDEDKSGVDSDNNIVVGQVTARAKTLALYGVTHCVIIKRASGQRMREAAARKRKNRKTIRCQIKSQ